MMRTIALIDEQCSVACFPPECLDVFDRCVSRLQAETAVLASELAKVRTASITVASMGTNGLATPSVDMAGAINHTDAQCSDPALSMTIGPKQSDEQSSPSLLAVPADLDAGKIAISLCSDPAPSMTIGQKQPDEQSSPSPMAVPAVLRADLIPSALSTPAGIDDCDASLKTAVRSLPRGLPSPWTAYPEGNLFSVVSSISWAARVCLFVGGFGRFPVRALQFLYIAAVLCSFLLCFFACVANIYFQLPPHYERASDAVTVWFHIFGFHAWITWRSFASDRDFPNALQRMLEDVGEANTFRKHTHRIFQTLLAGQFLAVIIGYIAHPMAAWDHYQHTPHTAHAEHTRWFAFAHAVSMWLAIPQHVPSLVIGIGLFGFVCDVHRMDAWRMLKNVQKHGGVEVFQCCEAAELLQDRLTQTCRKVCLLWAHMIGFATVLLLVAATDLNRLWNDTSVNVGDQRRRCAYNAFLVGFACSLCWAALWKPASVSTMFTSLPRNVVKALRCQGTTIESISPVLDFLTVEAVGFRIGITQISEETLGQFCSLMSVLLSMVLS